MVEMNGLCMNIYLLFLCDGTRELIINMICNCQVVDTDGSPINHF
jgi:hypothetical protein